MANFYMSLPAEEIARQIAEMLNQYNQLRRRHSQHSIINGAGQYFVELYGSYVIGCSAITAESPQVTRQYHLCVRPEFRRKGIAKKLKSLSLSCVETPLVYTTIREDNLASIRLNELFGFRPVKRTRCQNYYTITFGKDLRDGWPNVEGSVGSNNRAARWR